MDYYLFIFYLVGLLQEFLLVLYIRFIDENKILPAVILSFVTIVIGLLVIYNILAQLETKKSIITIIVYASGIATGTFLAMKTKKGFKN